MAHSPTCVTRHAVLLWRMAYVKLDTGILNSTLWVDRECREVFITALLMAEPFEATEPLPTYAVRTLDPTDFEVPIGWYGMVRAAGVGIVRFAMTEQEAGMLALERLAAPDPESRSQDFEGRRLVRVDGGYIVLNFFKYRDRDHTSATRSKRYRERLKAKGVTRDDDDDTRSVTEAGSSSSKQEAKADTSSSSSSAVEQLLASLPTDVVRSSWKAEMNAALQGAHSKPLTGAQIEEACRDYIGNGHSADKPSLRHFRAFLKSAGNPPADAAPRRPRFGEVDFAAARAKLQEEEG